MKPAKCKLCSFTTDEKGDRATDVLRDHWKKLHVKEHHQLYTKMAEFDNGSRFCVTCGKSQLSAGFINTCAGCLGWYCAECSSAHAKCTHGKSPYDALGEAA